jgi:hypothetical protein
MSIFIEQILTEQKKYATINTGYKATKEIYQKGGLLS